MVFGDSHIYHFRPKRINHRNKTQKAALYLMVEHRMKRLLLTIMAMLMAQISFSQGNDEALAGQYYEDKEYAKALPLYQELSDKQQDNVFLYDRYLSCLMETKAWDKAEKMVRKRGKKYPETALFLVDAGYVLEKEGKTAEADNVYNSLIKSLPKDYGSYSRLATAFQRRTKYEWAIKTLETGDVVFEGMIDFSSQLAVLYMETGHREKGLEKYVTLVLNSGLPFEQSQNMFEMNVTDSADFAVLRTILLRHIQKEPDNNLLAELLKWTFVKQKDWNGAYVQTKALDKRLKAQGARMIELGELCISNEAWEVAVQCFSYVKEYGEAGAYYTEGLSGLLESRYAMLVNGPGLKPEELQLLEADFLNFLSGSGYSERSWRATNRLAQLYMNYSHQPGKAIDLLETYINSPGVNSRTKAQAKLQLGDAYVIDGDVWSSELLYAQVEKDFEEDPLGQEAKFRRARLSWFRGDFDWAMVQLNVLKGATTQLISNNAIELSLTISENLGIDSNYDALEMYAHADLLIMQNQLDSAEMYLDSIPKKYPGHSLSDDILFERAQIREKQGRYAEAADLYETLAVAFNHDILADNAWYYLGILYENKLKDPEKAKEAFKKVVLDFPGSLYNVDARKQYRKLRGDNI